MKYGLIGEKLSHSFSPEIHKMLGGYLYELCELKAEELQSFFKKRDFCGINVTVPFKETVIEYLDKLSEEAKEIGAVNTVINKNGILTGYNTDAFGMSALIEKEGIELKGKTVLILGSGGTFKTARYVAKKLGAAEIFAASRAKKPGFLSYDSLDLSADVIINTTPCGMYEEMAEMPFCIEKFKNLYAYIDVVYNPLKTKTMQKAAKMGAKVAGGLYMLTFQGYFAAKLFGESKITNPEEVYKKLILSKQNLVLIGMPGAGKTLLAKEISRKTGREFIDTDRLFFEKYGDIKEYIETYGEEKFRALESEIIKEIRFKNGAVIAVGGGAVLRYENVENLKLFGKICLVNRDINSLSTENRPLSVNLPALYEKRREFYENAADFTVLNNGTADEISEKIIKEFLK